MLEILFGLLPLIFLCTAVGLLLLNINSVFSYLGYLLSILIKPREDDFAYAPMIQSPDQTTAAVPHKKVSLFTPFVRIYTLIKVLLFPNLNLYELLPHRLHFATLEDSVYQQKTVEEISKYQTKTYSAEDKKDNVKLRLPYEKMNSSAIVSDTFKQEFPELVNYKAALTSQLSNDAFQLEQNIIDNSTRLSLPADEPQFPADAPLPKLESLRSDEVKISREMLQTAVNTPTNKPYTAIEKPILPAEQKFQPVKPTIEKATFNTEPTNSALSINRSPEKIMPSERAAPTFDAIAALEEKVNNIKKERLTTPVTQPRFTAQFSAPPPSENITIPVPQQINTIRNVEPKAEKLEVFTNRALPSINIVGFLIKIVIYIILSLPLIVVVGSLLTFLHQNSYNMGAISEYPTWVAKIIENFVITTIIKS